MKTIGSLKKQGLTLLFICSGLIFQSCNEEANDISNEEQQEIAEFSTLADNSVDEELLVAEDEALADEGGGRRGGERCATVTRDLAAKTITVDFGEGCVGRFGRERSGRIIITYGGEFGDGMANRVVTFEDYVVNNRSIEGTIELRNFNTNDQGQLTAERRLVDYTITFPDGNSIVLNGSITRTLLEGGDDDVRGNEVIQLTGSFEGVSTRGRRFTRTIVDPIVANFTCRGTGGFLRVQGSEEITVTAARLNRTRIIRYGNGECDNVITIEVNGQTFTVSAE